MKLTKTLIGLTAAAVGVINTFASIVLPPGSVVALPTDAALITAPIATHVSPFVAATITGAVTSTAHIGEPGNPYGAGAITLAYEITSAPASTDAIGRLTVSGYSGFTIDVAKEASLGLWNFYLGTRGPLGDIIGGMVIVPSGFTSGRLLVYTDAPSYGVVTGAVINGSATGITAFAPVPEPAAYGLLGGLGLLGLAGYRRFLS